MKKTKLWGTLLVFATAALLTACQGTDTGKSTNKTTETTVAGGDVSGDIRVTDAISFKYSKVDMNEKETEDGAVNITLADDKSKTDGKGADIKDNTITITTAGTYIFTGSLTDGSIVVDAGKEAKVRLVLKGVTVSNSKTSPLVVLSADKTVLTLAAGTANSFQDGKSYGDQDASNACIYSSDDMTINGSGSLSVQGNFNNGIGCKNDLRIVNGTITIKAVNNGLKGNGSVAIQAGTVKIESGDDGIKSDEEKDAAKGYVYIGGGDITIQAGDDAIQAFTAITIPAGKFHITATGKKTNCKGKETVAEGLM